MVFKNKIIDIQFTVGHEIKIILQWKNYSLALQSFANLFLRNTLRKLTTVT